ncbi:hypothetical protein LIER_30224 [Lithospermum erythrorhizon]|uniref:SUF system FeS cluster assembly SufBD core domain-containing protein n=1 Tax=Lithospermum erythrorhizon TaxID=34254 RepID=A0AAV3RST5_LITER
MFSDYKFPCRYAQQTDAGQLTRSVLLEPRATINVKPKQLMWCSHGAAISDLEESQLFYFQARSIDIETARKALIFSFATEVVERISDSSTTKKVEAHIRELLDPVPSSKSLLVMYIYITSILTNLLIYWNNNCDQYK